jgi:hypothetical protein
LCSTCGVGSSYVSEKLVARLHVRLDADHFYSFWQFWPWEDELIESEIAALKRHLSAAGAALE